ncbi:unnamed protein product [Sphagnum jensenii]
MLCGNSFNVKHFDVVAAYLTNMHSTAKLFSQQMLRVRRFDELAVFVHVDKRKAAVTMSKEQLLDRWKHDYEARRKHNIRYDHTLDEYENSRAASKFQMDKHDVREDYAKIVRANVILDLDKGEFTPHEYSKYIIEKTFDAHLQAPDDEPVPEEMLAFVGAVHDKISNHDNFMLLNKFDIDRVARTHDDNIGRDESECDNFVPKSKQRLKDEFLLMKALDFIKKYDLIECMRDTNKEARIDRDQFVNWYNNIEPQHAEYAPTIDPGKKLSVTRRINQMLNIHGLRMTSRQIGGKQKRQPDGKLVRLAPTPDHARRTAYFIKPLIDYARINVDINELANARSFNPQPRGR